VSRWKTAELKLRRRFAANVRRLREEGHLSLEEAAHRGEMHWRHWQKIEAGEVSATLRTITKVGIALGVEPSSLF
jgi:transcriptional regulator with XRE-family HTH domain